MTEPAQLDIFGHEVPLDQVEPLEGGDAGHSAPSPSSDAHQLGLGDLRASSDDGAASAVAAADGRRGPTGNPGLAPSPGFTNELPEGF